MNNSLVTLVIPLYKAESYIQSCLESIVRQTYPEIEVIVVDDGSPDRSAEIARGIGEKDSRIKVISQENHGVSSARNRGIEAAHGDYIAFVDADDYLAPDFVEYMINLIQKTSTNFCLSTNCFTQKNERQIKRDTTSVLSSSDAVALLLSPKVIVGCWNKLFNLSFLKKNNLRFSTDLYYGEGLRFITQAAKCAGSVGIGYRKVYYYRRNNENSATSAFNINKLFNGEKALDLIEADALDKHRNAMDMYILHRCIFSLGAMTKTINHHCTKEYKDDYRRWNAYLRHNTPKLLLSPNVSLYRKALLAGGCVSPRLMAFLDNSRRRVISDKSV